MRQERLKPVLEELGDDWDGVEVDTDQAVITKHKVLNELPLCNFRFHKY